MKPDRGAPKVRTSLAPDGYKKRHLAGFGCPACGYKGWDAMVATGLNANRQAKAWFWCPSCHAEFVLLRQAWVWLGFRTLFVQIIAFSLLYSIVMLVQHQAVPWMLLTGICVAALCMLSGFTMVLRLPAGYHRQDATSS